MANPQSSYSIKDLEALSGIKSHTIRIWEKRFKLLKPKRTDTNIRNYSNHDLKKILNIGFLNKNGFKISNIVNMDEQEIKEKVMALSVAKPDNNLHARQLETAMLEMDEVAFSRVLNTVSVSMGMEKAFTNVIIQFFERLGLMWQTGTINPAQEHFASNLIRQKIISTIDQMEYNPDEKAPRIVLLLPEHELHEISLLFIQYALRKRKMNTLYLGQSVPWHSLQRTTDIYKPDFMVASFTNTLEEEFLRKHLSELRKCFPGKVFVAGKAFDVYNYKLPARFYRFLNFEDLLEKIKTHS